jgi:hypothetical protein
MGRGRGNGRRRSGRNESYAQYVARTEGPRDETSHRGGFGEPVGGSDEDGSELTASFGWGTRSGETFLGDGDRSEGNFLDHPNHNHYGSGNGPNDNVKDRDQYHGRGY